MATFTLSGSGTHAITAGTGALHVHVTTLPTIRGAGRAEPTNYYDLGLLRLGDGTYWWPSIPIDAEFQLLGCPQGTLEIAYALFNGTELSVVEVAGANPLAGSRALEDLSDVLIASVANNDVLKWNAAASKWENGAASTVATLEDLTDVLIASVANGQVLTWNSSASKWENGPSGGGTITSAFAQLAADVVLSATGTFFDGPSLALAAGHWLVGANVLLYSATSQNGYIAKLWDGVNVFSSGEVAQPFLSTPVGISFPPVVVVLSVGTTVKLSAAANTGSSTDGHMRAATVHLGAGNNATWLSAIQLA